MPGVLLRLLRGTRLGALLVFFEHDVVLLLQTLESVDHVLRIAFFSPLLCVFELRQELLLVLQARGLDKHADFPHLVHLARVWVLDLDQDATEGRLLLIVLVLLRGILLLLPHVLVHTLTKHHVLLAHEHLLLRHVHWLHPAALVALGRVGLREGRSRRHWHLHQAGVVAHTVVELVLLLVVVVLRGLVLVALVAAVTLVVLLLQLLLTVGE